MRTYGIDIICLQETWVSQAEYYFESGFKVILSGTDEKTRNWAGVGFVVAPWCVHLIHGFLQYSDRLASIKLKVKGGKVALITGYAPHNLKPYDERQNFYTQLGHILEKTSVNGSKFVLGDFNARIGWCRAGEEHAFGPYGFGREATHQVDVSNRELLLEFCTGYQYMVGNMLVHTPPSEMATFMNPGCRPSDDSNSGKLAMLDLALVPGGSMQELVTVLSIRGASLATDHFLVCCVLDCSYDANRCTRRASKNRQALQHVEVRQQFAEVFVNSASSSTSANDAVEDGWKSMVHSFQEASTVLPEKQMVAKKPWIREETLLLISQREQARITGDYALERSLHKAVRKAAKGDRGAWLDDVVRDGSWTGVRKLLQPRRVSQGRLRDASGELVGSELRADTMATHLETVQWRVRPAQVVDSPPLGPTLPVDIDCFVMEELTTTIRKLRSGKASGHDEIPAELFKALLSNAQSLTILLDFMNLCWQRREVPSDGTLPGWQQFTKRDESTFAKITGPSAC